MSVQEVKEAITRMTPEEMDEIALALEEAKAEQEADAWDEQIESDVSAGKLDFIIGELEAEEKAGRLRPL